MLPTKSRTLTVREDAEFFDAKKSGIQGTLLSHSFLYSSSNAVKRSSTDDNDSSGQSFNKISTKSQIASSHCLEHCLFPSHSELILSEGSFKYFFEHRFSFL